MELLAFLYLCLSMLLLVSVCVCVCVCVRARASSCRCQCESVCVLAQCFHLCLPLRVGPRGTPYSHLTEQRRCTGKEMGGSVDALSRRGPGELAGLSCSCSEKAASSYDRQ
jgi:hypothetical protein